MKSVRRGTVVVLVSNKHRHERYEHRKAKALFELFSGLKAAIRYLMEIIGEAHRHRPGRRQSGRSCGLLCEIAG